MSFALPTDGYGIYEDINPNQGQSVWGPRIDQMASGGFRVLINYGICYGSTANMLAYINYAATKGVRVAVALHTVWASADLSATFPTMYTESGSQGTTNYNAFATYVVNQVSGLSGLWGYYIADEPYNTSHATIKSMHDAMVTADSSHPILIICTSDTTTGQGTFWDNSTLMYDSCTVGGDDTYPIGLAANSVTGFTIGQMSADIQSFTASKSIKSAMVLQGFNFNSGGDPTLADMQAMLHQALGHMQAQLILWFSYYYVWGGPGGAYAAQAADPNASVLWPLVCQAIGTTPSRYMREVMMDSPVHFYKCDDPAPFAYGDDLMSTHVTTINSFVTRGQTDLLPGSWGTSQSYNGTTAATTLNTSGFFTGAHAFSLECWVKATWPGAGNYPGFTTFGTSGVGGESASLGFDGDAQRLIFIFKGLDEIQSLAAPANGTLYHLVGTYDGTQARFYVNGALQQPARNETLNITLTAAYIGRDIDGNNFSGTIEAVAYYDTALSAARVLAHYNAGLAEAPTAKPCGNGRFAGIR